MIEFLKNRFKNIDDGLLPFDYSRDSVNARDAIQLCQKAYFNVPAFRSTIDMLSDFADSDLYLEGGSEKSRKFVNAWFKRIKMHDIKSQYFREYYRSGNVFMYRLDGRIKTSDTGKVLETYGATKNIPIPIKLDLCILSKLSAITAFIPNNFVPFAAQSRDEPVPYSLPPMTTKSVPLFLYSTTAS